MPYDPDFAHRVREQLGDEAGVSEKAMFGGLAFLLKGNAAVGLSGRGEPTSGSDRTTHAAVTWPHTRLFDVTGRPMRGWILVALEGVRTKRQLASRVSRAIALARTLPPTG